MLNIFTGTNHLLDFKNRWNRTQKPFFHKKVKSGRQVLKSFQNPFFLILSEKNKFQKMLNHLSQVVNFLQ